MFDIAVFSPINKQEYKQILDDQDLSQDRTEYGRW